jgi:GDPmannose 4,6-dehydratase
MTVNYREAYGIFACNGILFNHESPRRGETFVTRKIVKRAVEIAGGKSKVLYLGNLNAVRDWGHAKDYVEGMWMILNHHTPDDWVLATGHAISVREFVEIVFNELDLKIKWDGKDLNEVGTDQNGDIRVAVDPRYFRPTEVPHLLGDAEKARTKLNWKPKYNLETLIKEMVSSEIALQK